MSTHESCDRFQFRDLRDREDTQQLRHLLFPPWPSRQQVVGHSRNGVNQRRLPLNIRCERAREPVLHLEHRPSQMPSAQHHQWCCGMPRK